MVTSARNETPSLIRFRCGSATFAGLAEEEHTVGNLSLVYGALLPRVCLATHITYG